MLILGNWQANKNKSHLNVSENFWFPLEDWSGIVMELNFIRGNKDVRRGGCRSEKICEGFDDLDNRHNEQCQHCDVETILWR